MKTITLDTQNSISALKYGIQANAILGIRDTGKTYTATYFAEQLMMAGIPIVVFDPIGVWRSLRTPKNPESQGFPVLIVGDDGDVELNPETIEDIILKALMTRTSVVIDLFSTRVMKSEWDGIVATAIRTIFYNNKRYGVRHIFFEEAAEFIHQQGKKTETFEWIDMLVRQAGNLLVGCTFINQRAEQMHKAILELCEGIVLHCQRGRNSIKAIEKWLDSANLTNAQTIVESLASLEKGECWVWTDRKTEPVHVERIPEKQSLHPERHVSIEDYTINYDIEGMIADLGISNDDEFTLPQVSFIQSVYTSPVSADEPVVKLIDPSQAYGIKKLHVKLARSTAYGNTTVANQIDDLIKEGFVVFRGGDVCCLEKTSGEKFYLSSDVEVNYAKVILGI